MQYICITFGCILKPDMKNKPLRGRLSHAGCRSQLSKKPDYEYVDLRDGKEQFPEHHRFRINKESRCWPRFLLPSLFGYIGCDPPIAGSFDFAMA